MVNNNKLEILAFQRIMNNCNSENESLFNIENVTLDSLECIQFVTKNKPFQPHTEIPIFFVKDIYEIITRYQQIIDQFDIEENIENIKLKQSDYNDFTKIQYLIMYLYSYKSDLLNRLINNSFETIEDKKDALSKIENIIELSFDELSNWLNDKGYHLYQNLINLVDIKYDSNIDKLFNIGIENNIYSPFSCLNIQNSIEKDFDEVQKFKIVFELKEEYKTNKYQAEIIQTKLPEHVLKYYFAAILLIPVLINSQEKVKVECWHTEEKKKLSSLNKILGPKEVNSGSTFVNNGNITILRNEEMHKVLLHEMMHAKKLDMYINKYQTELDIINWLKKHFCIPENTKILINESYVELWAVILNCIISAHHLKPDKLLCTIKHMLNIEKLFSCFQCAKILNFFNFEKFTDFYNVNGWTLDDIKNSKYKQNSSILSYYFLKSAILFNLNEFLNFCKSNKSIKDLLNFIKTEENINNYFNLIKKSLNNLDFHKAIDFYINVIKKNNNKLISNNNEFDIYSTLRMTAISFL